MASRWLGGLLQVGWQIGRSFVNRHSTRLAISYQPVGVLKTNPHNSRTHSKRQIRQIADSVQAFGFTNPVLLDEGNTIVAGHGRVSAAKLLGITELPTIRLEDLSADQVRAYVIADNRLAEKAGWDESILAIELQHLLTIESEFDICVTGFEIPEIDLLLSAADGTLDADDVFPDEEAPEPVTRAGDLWKLGKHQIVCGSAVDQDRYARLLGAKRADVVFVDPPYNVPIGGHVSGKGAIQHREFPMASGEMSEFEFASFLTSSLRLLARYSAVDSVHFVCMDWRHTGEPPPEPPVSHKTLIRFSADPNGPAPAIDAASLARQVCNFTSPTKRDIEPAVHFHSKKELPLLPSENSGTNAASLQ